MEPQSEQSQPQNQAAAPSYGDASRQSQPWQGNPVSNHTPPPQPVAVASNDYVADLSTNQSSAVEASSAQQPLPVVMVLSPVGVEYVFQAFALLVGAIGLASTLIALVNGKTDFSVLAFPVATLLICVPVFALLFLRHKKLELQRPALRLEPSKRRTTQFTQIVSFVVCLFTLIGLVYAVFAKLGGQSPISIGKAVLDAACILVVAGGILAYYWRDEHKVQ